MRQKLCHLDELDGDRLMLPLPISGEMVLVLRDRSGVHVVDALCPHQYAPLVGGELKNGVLECPMHQWRFDIRTGQGVDMPVCLTRYDAIVANGEVWVMDD